MTSQEYDQYCERAARATTTHELRTIKLEVEAKHPNDPQLRDIGETLATYAAHMTLKAHRE